MLHKAPRDVAEPAKTLSYTVIQRHLAQINTHGYRDRIADRLAPVTVHNYCWNVGRFLESLPAGLPCVLWTRQRSRYS